MRSRGYTLEEIADELGIATGNVSRLLSKLNDRALKANVSKVARTKVEQTQILWHSVSQAMRAWEASKEPLQRVRQLDDGSTVTEVVRREGNPTYLHTVFKALADIRSIWGLDVAPATVDPIQGIAQLAADLQRRGVEYETREAAAGNAGDTSGVPAGPGGGTEQMPTEPGPVQ